MNILCHFDEVPSLPEGFPSPFRYVPCDAVCKAASMLMERIEGSEELSGMFAEGKMLGVLVVEDRDGKVGFVSGFSGNAGGRSIVDGFVPPVFDLLAPEGHYKVREREISMLGERIAAMQQSEELSSLRQEISRLEELERVETDAMRISMAESRKRRDFIRKTAPQAYDSSILIKESQHEKASFRRLKKQWEDRIGELRRQEKEMTGRIEEMKSERRSMSDRLQRWIFRNYIVHNAEGGESTIWDIFSGSGIVPPGGTGECAAPKMLEYAYRHTLKPLAMGEFWYGESPRTAVRVHGHFYPSCKSKCGPLLGFMLRGLDIRECLSVKEIKDSAEILYIDGDIIVACKPSGMPSVPGLDGKVSLQEHLSVQTGSDVLAVHRLDMDTSGVMVFARNSTALAALRSQFESRTVCKKYIARLCPPDPDSPVAASFPGPSKHLSDMAEGTISLPLSPDYDERPRQKADLTDGKEAVTIYRILKNNPDGTTDVEFRPLTGRTHQLRVHSAHPLGLGRPIVGDLLYGGHPTGKRGPVPNRLHLHALSLSFTHPVTGKQMTFSTSDLSFPV